MADLVADANAARPVTAGGTGSGTAVGGNDNLNVAGASIASAATVNLANATGVALTITGTVTITSFGTVAAGAERVLTFAAALTLTYNATSMILPGAADITTAAGDAAIFRSLGGGNWKCISYQRANGSPISNTLTQPTLILKQGAAPTPTAEGDTQWDTDDNILLIGDGAAAKTFVPIPASTAAGDIEYFSGAKAKARLAKGTAGQSLVMNAGATAPTWGGGRTLATAVATTSGTAIDFTGIPSWATQISIALAGVSTSGTSMMVLRLGSSSGGVEATGYVGATVNAGAGAGSIGANYSTGFNIAGNILAGENQSGVLTLTLLDAAANQWACGVCTGNGAVAYSVGGGGYKSLSSTLDRVRLTMVNGTDTFDAGKVNISWS